jgi:lytic murein transglycosylase
MRIIVALVAVLVLALPARADKAASEADFQRFLHETVRAAARSAGVSDATFAAATGGLTLAWDLPDLKPPGAPDKDTSGAFQAEFSSPGRYFNEGNLAALGKSGRTLANSWRAVLARVEARTGVPATILLAIWGRESNYGKATIAHPAIRTLATQAFMGSRREIFLPELVAALRILEEDHIPAAMMRSSWAGALGQPQFMPTKFLAHAADGDGDGRRDIWTSVPDTLASIGSYLHDHGWRRGLPWGVEIALPGSVSCTLEGPHQGRPAAEWDAMGIVRRDGGQLPGEGNLHLLLPAGRLGPAFLVTENFYVLKRYNESDLYALFVGHLADRIAGPAEIAGRWSDIGGFTRGDVRSMQHRLIAAGHDVGGPDGLVGFRTRIAVGREQERNGSPATCFPDRGFLAR